MTKIDNSNPDQALVYYGKGRRDFINNKIQHLMLQILFLNWLRFLYQMLHYSFFYSSKCPIDFIFIIIKIVRFISFLLKNTVYVLFALLCGITFLAFFLTLVFKFSVRPSHLQHVTASAGLWDFLFVGLFPGISCLLRRRRRNRNENT